MSAAPSRTIRVFRETAGDPLVDTALSRVLLDDVSARRTPESLRLYRPQPHVAFGRRDAISPGYADAVRAASDLGYAPVERLAGGRAAVFHEDTVAFAWAVPDPRARDRIQERFEVIAGIVVDALRAVGVDAHLGEVAGEYCPGEFSVNAGRERKIMGVGQRIVRDAAHIGGVIVVAGADRVRDVLLPVYEAMGFAWRPETTGDVVTEAADADFDAVADALERRFAAEFRLERATVEPDTLARARSRAGEFVPRL